MAIKKEIDLEVKDLEIVRQTLKNTLPNKKVWAYGSRVKLNANRFSDLDLVVFDASESAIEDCKEAFEESSLSCVVSLVLWSNLPIDFQKNIQNNYKILSPTFPL